VYFVVPCTWSRRLIQVGIPMATLKRFLILVLRFLQRRSLGVIFPSIVNLILSRLNVSVMLKILKTPEFPYNPV